MGDETAFVPGHGPMSTFGHERATNPFVGDAALRLGLTCARGHFRYRGRGSRRSGRRRGAIPPWMRRKIVAIFIDVT